MIRFAEMKLGAVMNRTESPRMKVKVLMISQRAGREHTRLNKLRKRGLMLVLPDIAVKISMLRFNDEWSMVIFCSYL